MCEVAVTRLQFVKHLLNGEEIKQSHYNVLRADQYQKLFSEVKDAKAADKKTTLQYRRLKRFDILEVDGAQRLISNSNNSSQVKLFLSVDEVFDVIREAHEVSGHGGRDRVKALISKKYANVTTNMISTFISLCPTCQKKKGLTCQTDMNKARDLPESDNEVSSPVNTNDKVSEGESSISDADIEDMCKVKDDFSSHGYVRVNFVN